MWVIDRSFVARDGRKERFRRAAQVQNRAAAEAEERRIIDYFALHGTILPLMKPAQRPTRTPKGQKKETPKTDDPSWEDAVDHFRSVVLPTKKPSTRQGYESMLEGPHFARWRKAKLSEINYAEVTKWDTMIVKSGVGPSTRRNHHVVLRSVLKSIGPYEGQTGLYLAELPKLPKLPRVGKTVVHAASPEDVALLLNEKEDENKLMVRARQRRAARLAFALACFAGLRASEVRALRRRDVDLKRKAITVRFARCDGQEAPPKSGHEREIPIADRLLVLLEPACKGLDPEDYVARKIDGTPWGDHGLIQALQRACERLGISGSRYHGLRHFFATSIFGVADARTVQALLGHASLEVTQRYAHHQHDRAVEAVSIFS